MAIPFFEPKAKTTPNNQNSDNNASNNNLSSNIITTNMYFDQVDGHIINSIPLLSQLTTITTTTSPTAVAHAVPATIATPATFSIPPTATPPTTPPTAPAPTTATTTATSDPIATVTAPTASIEQQALAWKILALALCKALKEYYVQTASAKDAFTNQTVQVLPNGEVQPLWKP